jgi:hypothetical protein
MGRLRTLSAMQNTGNRRGVWCVPFLGEVRPVRPATWGNPAQQQYVRGAWNWKTASRSADLSEE